jgi:hypothetical protein
MHFIDATKLLRDHSPGDPGCDVTVRLREFKKYEQQLLSADLSVNPLCKQSIFLVGYDEDIWRCSNSKLVRVFERDLTLSKKIFIGVSELRSRIGNPFLITKSAHVRAAAFLVPQSHFGWNDVPSNTASSQFDADDLETIIGSALPTFICDLTTLLYRRMMGSDRNLFWDADGPKFSYMNLGDEPAIPFQYISNGERIAFLFALYLSLENSHTPSASCLGISSALSALDPLSHIMAMDCLRDFVFATGACVYYATDNATYRRAAEGRLKPAMNIEWSAAI